MKKEQTIIFSRSVVSLDANVERLLREGWCVQSAFPITNHSGATIIIHYVLEREVSKHGKDK